MPATKSATKATGKMSMAQIKSKAEYLGITPGKMKKHEIIHAIQRAEGCAPCFGTSNGTCIYTDCCFMQDCLKLRQ